MAKAKTKYVCNSCGESFSAWSGKCTTCGEWNTIQQVLDVRGSKNAAQAVHSGTALEAESVASHIGKQDTVTRIPVHVADIDNVLGGGLVPGSITLLAGQPGIGKSTLLLQLAYAIAASQQLLYVSGEESPNQVAMRGKRLHNSEHTVLVASSNSANDIAATIASGSYKVVIVDSIQTIATDEITGVPGSVSQVTNSAQLLMLAAKQSNTAVILVGHVTKEGAIAGPKVLEHLVDVVLQLEGDRYAGFRVLRGIKNRFGSTNEAVILDMTEKGLEVVHNPSAALLAERQVSDGSIVLATLEGTRPILVEVQALVNTTSYGYPKRAASGFDLNRLNLLVAMLERRTKLKLADKDIYINIVGGIKISENAADLAVCMAIASATKGMQLSTDAVVFGEVGLSGEVRHVPWTEKRIQEAKKLGFTQVIGPRLQGTKKAPIEYIEAKDVRTVLNTTLMKGNND
jgi:DNA repair protein RadA/Sms